MTKILQFSNFQILTEKINQLRMVVRMMKIQGAD